MEYYWTINGERYPQTGYTTDTKINVDMAIFNPGSVTEPYSIVCYGNNKGTDKVLKTMTLYWPIAACVDFKNGSTGGESSTLEEIYKATIDDFKWTVDESQYKITSITGQMKLTRSLYDGDGKLSSYPEQLNIFQDNNCDIYVELNGQRYDLPKSELEIAYEPTTGTLFWSGDIDISGFINANAQNCSDVYNLILEIHEGSPSSSYSAKALSMDKPVSTIKVTISLTNEMGSESSKWSFYFSDNGIRQTTNLIKFTSNGLYERKGCLLGGKIICEGFECSHNNHKPGATLILFPVFFNSSANHSTSDGTNRKLIILESGTDIILKGTVRIDSTTNEPELIYS